MGKGGISRRGGFVVGLYNALMHGVIMAGTYEKYESVFAPPKPVWFMIVAIAIGVAGGLLFGKTRAAWGEGVKGGVTF